MSDEAVIIPQHIRDLGKVVRDPSPVPKGDKDAFRRAQGATLRALSGEEALDVAFAANARGLIGSDVYVFAPARHLPAEEAALTRGEVDGQALRQRHHDAQLHARFAPEPGPARLVYDALEQVRYEALGSQHMAGVTANLERVDAERRRNANLDAEQALPLHEFLRYAAQEAITGRPPPAELAAQIAEMRQRQGETLAAQLQQLAICYDDQQSYAQQLRRLLQDLGLAEEGSVDADEAEADAEPPSEPSDAPDSQPPRGEDEAREGEMQPDPLQPEDASAESEAATAEDSQAEESAEGSGEDSPLVPPEYRNYEGEEAAPPYQVYTSEFDEIRPAETLCDEAELNRLRLMLDQQVQGFQSLVAKLANRLQRRLLAKQQRSWEFNLEEGLLDTARLDRVVTAPTAPLAFKRERDTEFRDTLVSLLIDNSGSMRGRPIATAALCADILARTLERSAVKVEILGFTTVAWKGGKSRERWIDAEKPSNPGRLNDLRHIIYKAADAPWRRTRKNLGLMLREGLLKENIDGEALAWAYSRLQGRPERRKILLVISDGAPVDDSTLGANRGNYLEAHLRDVIAQLEAPESGIELCAIGIGHDVTRHYRRAVMVSEPEQLGGAVMGQLLALFDSPVQQKGRRG